MKPTQQEVKRRRATPAFRFFPPWKSTKDARLKRELEREQALRDLNEAAAKREEVWNRLEATGWDRKELAFPGIRRPINEGLYNMGILVRKLMLVFWLEWDRF